MSYLITGGGGFIGSSIAEELVKRGEKVRILDNFSTGKRGNLSFANAGEIEIVEGNIRNFDTCRKAVKDVDYVLHHAALVSVPQSAKDPLLTTEINITGTLNMLLAARDAGVKRFIHASSCAVYGDRPTDQMVIDTSGNVSPIAETIKPNPLSPYAISKLTGEEYCKVFYKLYKLETIALRYFNVFGKRQDPQSEYAAVIPKFIKALLQDKQPVIYGDGKQSRDFIFIDDIVNANLKACTAPSRAAGRVFNIACNKYTTITQLLDELKNVLEKNIDPTFMDAREGDIQHSMADISLAREILGFEPEVKLQEGLERTVKWFYEKSNETLAQPNLTGN